MKDFLNQELSVGDFVAYPGKGNVAAEYGLLVLKITRIEKGKIYGLRVDTTYDGPQDGSQWTNYLKKTNIGNKNKVVKIVPPSFILAAFDRLEASPFMSEKHSVMPQLSKWVHGSESFSWNIS